MNDGVQRQVVFTNKPISGFFRYKNAFQIIPSDETWNRTETIRAHHPLMLEIKLSNINGIALYRKSALSDWPVVETDESIPNEMLEFDKKFKAVEEINALLTLFSGNTFFVYDTKKYWFAPLSTLSSQSFWGQQSYAMSEESNARFQGSEFTPHQGQEIEYIEQTKFYTTYAHALNTSPIQFPNSIHSLLDKYFHLRKPVKNVFFTACLFFNQAVEIARINSALGVALLASSLESIIDFEHKGMSVEHCHECGQPKYGVRQKFLKFLSENANGSTEFRKVADTFYKWRSKVFHAGQFTDDDGSPLVIPPHREQFIVITRICLVNWLLKYQEVTEQKT